MRRGRRTYRRKITSGRLTTMLTISQLATDAGADAEGGTPRPPGARG